MPQTLVERTMAVSLRALNRVASSDALDRLGWRSSAERLLRDVSRGGARTATRAGRTFVAAQKLARPARQPLARGPRLFDITPDDEQRMLRDAVGEFARDRLRPAASDADAAGAAAPELLAQANELGLTMISVPEELGGAVERRSATTSVLMAEALARGDMGIAAACLAAAAVSTALSLWGDADQQARYLPPFVSEDVPAASLALMEPAPLFDPFALSTRARAQGSDYVLDGVKALVPRAADAELFVVAAQLPTGTPGLFVVEPGSEGLSVAPDPGIGIRAAATARLELSEVSVPRGALLAEGAPEAYADCVALGRLAWCALALGTGRAALEYVSEYVKSRRAFGEPVAHRQGVAFTVADMAIELEGLRLATYRAAARVDQGLPFHREVALARRLLAERGMRIGSDAVQMLGGHGYTKEHPVERWYRDLRVAGVIEGGLLA
ncbi:MAG TPA: acyl-CoA dehydrogenase family protein [Solirubrobacteraceae bacterium]|nr:acyl-CoA dehydrogenase family protein [Solirubrobacteraceae bacterium]